LHRGFQQRDAIVGAAEMRAHFHSFPKFSGAVTHFAMLRERLVG
jgi:hypothetical protein